MVDRSNLRQRRSAVANPLQRDGNDGVDWIIGNDMESPGALPDRLWTKDDRYPAFVAGQDRAARLGHQREVSGHSALRVVQRDCRASGVLQVEHLRRGSLAYQRVVKADIGDDQLWDYAGTFQPDYRLGDWRV